MLLEKMGHGSELASDLGLIAEQLGRMSPIVDDVRGFARKSEFELRPTLATQPGRAALALMSETYRLAGIEVVERLAPELPSIQADETRLQQVFLNLLSNALHACQGYAGRKRIEMGACAERDGVRFWVEDSGPGISEHALSKVFEPFFTTKDPPSATGLGLSPCYVSAIMAGRSA